MGGSPSHMRLYEAIKRRRYICEAKSSEKHDQAQPFTEVADLELEKRLKDLQSTETQDSQP